MCDISRSRDRGRVAAIVSRQALCLLLAALFVLASVIPPLLVLLPRDPLAALSGPPAGGHAASGPTIWFPLAYALTGLPDARAHPARSLAAALNLLGQPGYGPMLARTVPALPARAARWPEPLSCVNEVSGAPALRPDAAEPSLPDPPPRPARFPAA